MPNHVTLKTLPQIASAAPTTFHEISATATWKGYKIALKCKDSLRGSDGMSHTHTKTFLFRNNNDKNGTKALFVKLIKPEITVTPSGYR